MKCCNSKGDGGRSSGAALQGEASNNPELLRSRAVVVSVREKASVKTSCVEQQDERKRTTAEASKRSFSDIKTGFCIVIWEESSGSLPTGWVVSGVKVA